MQRALAFVFVTALLDSIGFGIIAPVMPQLLMEVSGQGISQAAQYGGALMTAYAAMQLVFSPLMGNLSDRVGRRPVLLISLSVLCFDYAMMSWAPTLAWLFLGRFIGGVAASTFSICGAFIADVTPPAKRAQSFGIIGAAFGLGFIIGPVLGGMLSAYGTRAPFMGAAALTALSLVYGTFVLPETLAPENRRPFDLRRANPVGTLLSLRKHPSVLGMIAAYFIFLLGHQSLPAMWSYFVIERFQWSEAEVGYSLGFVGLVMVVVQAFLLGLALKRLGERRAAYLGYAFAIFSFFGFAAATRSWQLYPMLVACGLQGFVSPALRGLMSAQVPANAQGELQGGLSSLMSLSQIVSPPVLAQVFAVFTQHGGAAPYLPGAPWLLAALFTIVSAVVLARTHGAGTPTESPSAPTPA
jgi:DHA1 family tetracycline resistance protein-like MFS transporter